MIYTYRCKTCGATTDAHRKVKDRANAPECHACGGGTKHILVPVRFNAVMGGHDNPGYQCPVTDTWVDSKRKRRSIMDEHNLIEMPKASAT